MAKYEIKHPGRALAILFGIALILSMTSLFDRNDAYVPSSSTARTPLAVEKGAAWQQGTKLLTDKLWNPEYAEWSKVAENTSSVSYLGLNEDNKRLFLIGGTIRTKNNYGQWIVNMFSATMVCYGENDWRLVTWEFEE